MDDLLDNATDFVSEKIKKPEATIKDVDFKRLSFTCIEYLAKVSVLNHYPQPIPICKVEYVLKSSDRTIASGKIEDQGSLKGGDTTLLEVPVKVPHTVLITLGRSIFVDWNIDYELELGLVFDLPVIGNFTIPLSTKGQIKLPTFSDIFPSFSSAT